MICWRLQAFGAAIFSHEAAVTLPVVSWTMWVLFGRPERLANRRMLAGGLATAVALFAAVTVVANRRNTLFTESHYTIGVHMLRHALDYVVTLYIGPNGWVPYAESLVLIAVLIAATPATRFGALWLIFSMLPVSGGVPHRRILLATSICLRLGFRWPSRRLSQREATSYRDAGSSVPDVRRQGSGWSAGSSVFDSPASTTPPSDRRFQSMEPWRVFADELAHDRRRHPPQASST